MFGKARSLHLEGVIVWSSWSWGSGIRVGKRKSLIPDNYDFMDAIAAQGDMSRKDQYIGSRTNLYTSRALFLQPLLSLFFMPRPISLVIALDGISSVRTVLLQLHEHINAPKTIRDSAMALQYITRHELPII